MIIVGIVSLVILAGGAWFYQNNAPKDTLSANYEALVRGNSMKIKAADEKLVVVEFADYQCPACGYIAPGVVELREKYKDSVTFVHRDFPLNIHAHAMKAAQMSYIAEEQGKYWEMHDKLFSTQNDWESVSDPTDLFISYAESLGMKTDKIKEDLSSGKYTDRIKNDVKDGESLGVVSTPTFFVGNTIIREANYAAIKQAIDTELAK